MSKSIVIKYNYITFNLQLHRRDKDYIRVLKEILIKNMALSLFELLSNEFKHIFRFTFYLIYNNNFIRITVSNPSVNFIEDDNDGIEITNYLKNKYNNDEIKIVSNEDVLDYNFIMNLEDNLLEEMFEHVDWLEIALKLNITKFKNFVRRVKVIIKKQKIVILYNSISIHMGIHRKGRYTTFYKINKEKYRKILYLFNNNIFIFNKKISGSVVDNIDPDNFFYKFYRYILHINEINEISEEDNYKSGFCKIINEIST